MRVLGLLAILSLPAAAQTPTSAPVADPARVEQVVAATFAKAPADWLPRVAQDETQRQCSLARNQPDPEVADAIVTREKATVVMPKDGVVLGDWKRGEALAQNGRGGQFSDAAGTVQGGNCYACHQLAPAEISYGTLGPSLSGYGRERGFDPVEARAAYGKIYNAQSVLACSTMPRFGHNGVLTEQQIKDAVAFLFDPASPVNAAADGAVSR